MRPERTRPYGRLRSCIRPAGASPAAVSAERRVAGSGCAERSNHLSGASKALAKPYGSVEGSKPAGPMRKREPLQPRDIRNRKGEAAEPITPRRRQQTAPENGGVQDASGVEKRARREGLMRNWGDPTRRPTLGEGGAYKPTAKWRRAERESEGLIVPTKVVKATGGRGPHFGRACIWG